MTKDRSFTGPDPVFISGQYPIRHLLQITFRLSLVTQFVPFDHISVNVLPHEFKVLIPSDIVFAVHCAYSSLSRLFVTVMANYCHLNNPCQAWTHSNGVLSAGIFGQPLYRRLYNDFRRRGWLDPPYEEPFALPKGTQPRRFERLCLRALAEGAVSDAKAAELLGITLDELRRLMEEPPDAADAAHR